MFYLLLVEQDMSKGDIVDRSSVCQKATYLLTSISTYSHLRANGGETPGR